MEDQMNYYRFSREQWKQFYRNNQHQVPLTAANLHEIEAFNDRISLDDVRDIYMPFAHLLQAKYEHYLSWRETESVFYTVRTANPLYYWSVRKCGSWQDHHSTVVRDSI